VSKQQALDLLSYFDQPELIPAMPWANIIKMATAEAADASSPPSQDTVAETSSPPQDPSSGNAGQGKSLFESKCSSCHTIGGGKLVGPDLENITGKRPHEWLVDFIMDPEKLFSQNDPTATQLLNEYGFKMPDLGLSREQVLDILAYLKNPSEATAAPPQKEERKQLQPAPQQEPAKEQQAAAGDSHKGYLLFTGEIAFKNNAIHCKSCHTIGGLPFPYGGTVGPSLKGIYSVMGPQALTQVLQTIPYPTMRPIYYPHPLTDEEISNLVAFFKEADGKKAPSITLLLALPMAGGGFILGMIATWLIWRRRITTVRKRLIELVNKGHLP
jgi:mono/diheme cytochrome c family protein